jgi:Protein of unknown function (DUF3455)
MINKYIHLIGLLLSAQSEVMAENATTEAIKVPNENTLQMTVHAKGVQIFSCVFEGHAYTWIWQAPDAQLYDGENQKPVGSHGVGPTWQHQDGSSVKGKIVQKIDAPDKTAAPWLLLEATENKGSGVFSQTGFIMRINTKGGIAPPTEECDENHAGSEKRVAYSADYSFYRK